MGTVIVDGMESVDGIVYLPKKMIPQGSQLSDILRKAEGLSWHFF